MYIGSHSKDHGVFGFENKPKQVSDNIPKKAEEHKMGVMNFILIFSAAVLIIFSAVMIYLFMNCGSIPDTLCSCVFAVLGGECGVMGWIKTNKDKIRERKWEKEDALSGKEKANDL